MKSARVLRRFSSSASQIFKSSIANKTGLSKKLDATLKSHHDMKVFGIGFMNSIAGKSNHVAFLASHGYFYEALETSLDSVSSDPSSEKCQPLMETLQSFAKGSSYSARSYSR